ncbi:MAG: site-2 protease family protein [Merdibacter sp.]
MMHLLFPFPASAMASCSLISVSFAGYLMEINQAMLLFNLLPVVPLDGGRIMQTLFHLWLPYAEAQRLGVLCSFAALPVVFLWLHARCGGDDHAVCPVHPGADRSTPA